MKRGLLSIHSLTVLIMKKLFRLASCKYATFADMPDKEARKHRQLSVHRHFFFNFGTEIVVSLWCHGMTFLHNPPPGKNVSFALTVVSAICKYCKLTELIHRIELPGCQHWDRRVGRHRGARGDVR